jgi:adenine-specific DNA-methyltransferase
VAKPARPAKGGSKKSAESYQHKDADSPMRPDVGTQAQFRKKKAPVTWKYDSSLSPALDYDGQNAARERGEALLKQILEAGSLDQAKAAAAELKAISKPFLNWAGKAERLSFDVPTLPLFIHERLSTKAIIETLTGHKVDKQQSFFDLFGDPQHSVTDQILRAYEHRDRWVNRMILGDSLAVMNSLLQYEGLGGQVQMIYIDPPYGVKFGSNFQPFVRRRDVTHNDDEDMTREPEMVQAYRDTWELGLHSYLTYLRDRLLLARDLLHPSGSVFVQISDENLHHVRELMDEVFGPENFVCVISAQKTGGLAQSVLPVTADFVLWYSPKRESMKFRPLYLPKIPGEGGYQYVELSDATRRRLTAEESENLSSLPGDTRIFQPTSLESANPTFPFEFRGKEYVQRWKTNVSGLHNLAKADRLYESSTSLRYIRYISDFPVVQLTNTWTDTGAGSFLEPQLYVVQTVTKIIQRCILMTTDPGDLVLDPTSGSGTTAYVSEQWGRRWITVDTSRVPLALARQRLLTATFPWYELRDAGRGPAGGFVFKRKQNKKGEEVGGIVPHVTLKSIANNDPPGEEVLVDRPEIENGITRVTGPFTFEATIPTPVDWEGDGVEDSGVVLPDETRSYVDRMLEVLRRSPVLRLEGNRTVTFTSIRPPAKTLSLSAEAAVDDKPVAIVFGPENGAVSEKLVYEAAREAHAKNYTHLYVIGFAVQPNARTLVEQCQDAVGVAATYVQATPDLLMGDLLKNMRSSQIFSVCGLPEVEIAKLAAGNRQQAASVQSGAGPQFQVKLVGLDVFDPTTMALDKRKGTDVPAWFLDTDYNGLSFHVSQAFFPRTGAWENLKKALKGDYDEAVWDHLAGDTSAPFEAGEHKQIAVKVIDDRGNELMVVKPL